VKKKESEIRYESMENKSAFAPKVRSAVESNLRKGYHDFTAVGYCLFVHRDNDDSPITRVDYYPNGSWPLFFIYKVAYTDGKFAGLVFTGIDQ